jgi:hypothetical protein
VLIRPNTASMLAIVEKHMSTCPLMVTLARRWRRR